MKKLQISLVTYAVSFRGITSSKSIQLLAYTSPGTIPLLSLGTAPNFAEIVS
jgi:hypothetical protein